MSDIKKPYELDVPVLILFFNRPYLLKKVFEQVKKAKPCRLYLYQDGVRADRPDDVENIAKCREIVSDIDWECEVFTNYQEENVGCDPSEYNSQKWMFESEEMGIVLEDDDVPSQSFFTYCRELLYKYKDDERINMICGMNNLNIADHCPYDYLFTSAITITGWASWKRVIDNWVDHVPFVDDEYAVSQFNLEYKCKRNVKEVISRFRQHNSDNIAYYESILDANALMNHSLNIVPTKNLISNIGNDGDSTHGVSNVNMLPKGIRRIFNMKTYELEFPLKHPPYIIEDLLYLKKLNRIMAYGHPIVQFYRRFESVFLRLRYGEFSSVIKSLKRFLHIK